MRQLVSVVWGALGVWVACGAPLAQAQSVAKAPEIHFIWMGGNDCPPCVRWRREELPKLQASPEFAHMRFTYVTKQVSSAVPPALFLPADVEPYKDQLDEASNRRTGSPQAALLVNGVVHDYFFGTRTAEQIEDMVQAVRTHGPGDYPFTRCLKVAKRGRDCEKPA
jgi:hypothetical protein